MSRDVTYSSGKDKNPDFFFAMNNRTFFSAKQARNFSEMKKNRV